MSIFSCFSCFGFGVNSVIIPTESEKETIYMTQEGVVMKGHITKGELNGEGEILYPNFMIEKGFFEQSQLNGVGEVTLPTGTKMQGSFHEGNPIEVDVTNNNGKSYHAKFTDHGIEITRTFSDDN